MLEKPDLQDAKIVDWLLDHFGIRAVTVKFLPTGYQNTAAYRVVAEDDTSYFLKLRRDVFEKISVTLPVFLQDLGLRQIIAPIPGNRIQYPVYLDDFNVILYPFVEGHNAFQVALTQDQWFDFGFALKRIHSISLPLELMNHIPSETYSPEWREKVKVLLEQVQQDTFHVPMAAQLAGFMKSKARAISHLVRRAEQLSSILQMHAPDFVLCHSDIHAGNILCNPDGSLYIIDWDNPILAPKERDLMFVGGGVGGIWNSAHEEAFFYQGYGETELNPVALTYYRFERILQDVGPNLEQFLFADASNQDRIRTLQGLERFFLPNDVVEMAYQAEKSLPSELQSG
jgi:spectinomycin phosphotransferase